MNEPKKDTIYVDVDDEITSIIEKVRSSPQKIVALVLPKRAAVFQSIVNMKLLKRSADEAKKGVVLITSEAGLMPMAGVVGLHVAKTLQSKPHLPSLPKTPSEGAASEVAVDQPDGEAALDTTQPIGKLAGLSEPDDGTEETIEVGEDADAAIIANKPKKNKKLKVPNFGKFRTRLLIGGVLLVLLLSAWFVMARVLPSAKVTIQTNTENINSNVKFISNPNATELDLENNIVPAITKNIKKNEGQRAPASGQKNIGEKATGTVRLINCSQNDKLSDTNRTVSAGTAITSQGLTFILDEPVEVEPSSFKGNTCQKNKSSDPVAVTAQNPGNAYNVPARTYNVAGFASITGEGSEMSGGADNLVKVVSQGDIDGLTQRITEAFTESAKQELSQQLAAEGFVPLVDTFSVGQPITVSSPNVNDQAEEVKANVTMDFSMQGVKSDDLKKLIDEAVSDEIDVSRQSILDYGLDSAVFQINERQENGNVSYSLQAVLASGPEINTDRLKSEIAGRKSGEAENLIKEYPGVKEVSVDLSPFWVVKTPGNPNKITLIIETSTQDSNDE